MGGSKLSKQKRRQNRTMKHRRKAKNGTQSLGKIEESMLNTKEFPNFAATCTEVKKSVYIIARVRKEGDNTRITTLGTGFLCAPRRLLTCAHVIDNDENKHKKGDEYLLVQSDEYGNWHRSSVKLTRDKDLFVYHDTDSAVIYLPKSFYRKNSGEIIKSEDIHLKLSAKTFPIGTDVGVMGYPMQTIGFNKQKELDVSSIKIRADKGVINTGHRSNGVTITEFTMAFNPGNSGGPIFHASTGEVIAIVHGYNSLPIRFIKEDLPGNLQKQVGQKEIISSIRALYSIGICGASLKHLGSEHKINFS